MSAKNIDKKSGPKERTDKKRADQKSGQIKRAEEQTKRANRSLKICIKICIKIFEIYLAIKIYIFLVSGRLK